MNTLGDVALIFVGKPDTVLLADDITLVRVGTDETIMKPAFGQFLQCPENSIIVRVQRKDILSPKYLYWVFEHLFISGQSKQMQRGSLQRYVQTEQIRKIGLEPRG